jgi:hypothetical protein
MRLWIGRLAGRRWIALWLLLVTVAFGRAEEAHSQTNWTIPPRAPVLVGGNFECADGYVEGTNPIGKTSFIHTGWSALYLTGAPSMGSTQLTYAGSCSEQPNTFIEKLEGGDSLVVRSQDIETLPEPGKPFDLALYQQITATVGGEYSLSGWMVTTCEDPPGSRSCPDGVYIAKAIGIDPRGGVDPDAPSVIWEENHINYVDEEGKAMGWQNLRLGVRALAPKITVFARMTSPTQLRGNKGFMDAMSLVRAPVAALLPLPAQVMSETVEIEWTGMQSADVAAIPGGTYQLLFDLQVRQAGGEWRDWLVGEIDERSMQFTPGCTNASYEFRVRARAEQPPAPPEGASPNHRYPGAWSEPVTVFFAASDVDSDVEPSPPAAVGEEALYLPITVGRDC